MAKKTTTAPSSDEITLRLIQQVDEQRKAIKNLKRSSNNKTNMTFSYNETALNGALNLNALNKVDELIKIAAFLFEKKKSYESVASEMQVENVPEFKWMGFSLEDWIQDIKNKIDRIQISIKETKLNSLETRLESVISPELRAKRELEAISNELNG